MDFGKTKIMVSALCLTSLLLSACGGGAGGGGGGVGGGASAPAATYSISAAVTGLAAGQSVTLLDDNGGNSITVTTNGLTTLSNALSVGAAYIVTVDTQPAAQVCSVINGSGTVGTANVTVQVDCPSPAKYAYVANYGNNNVSQYTIGVSGALTAMAPPTVAAGSGASFVTVDPTGTYAYVANETASGVSQYTIGAGGALIAMTPPTVTTGSNPYSDPISVAVDPTGKYTYVANRGTNVVSQYAIGASGALTAMTPPTVATGFFPYSVTVDPTGKFAYVANYNDNTVSQYTIGASGALTAMTPPTVTTGAYPYFVTVDPTGKYAYIANYSAGTISQYAIGVTGALTANGVVVMTAGSGPVSIVLAP